MNRGTSSAKRRNQGFALVITLITITLLTIMAVAFLASSSSDQATSRAVANKAKADLAATTAVNCAIARLIDNLTNYPDSATGWERVSSGTQEYYQGTILYYHQEAPQTLNVVPPGSPPGTSPSPTPIPSLYVLPLISGAVARPTPTPDASPDGLGNQRARESALRSALPILDDANAFNLNHQRFTDDQQGWIGASPTPSPAPTPSASPSPTPPPFRGKWVDQTNSDGLVSSRYAYWMEDESFKANVNLMGNTPRGSTTLGDSPTQIPIQGLLPNILPTASPAPDYATVGNDIMAERSNFPGLRFFELKALNQVPDPSYDFPKLFDQAKFTTTLSSGSLNLSRSGSKPANLNKIVVTSTDPIEVRKQVDEIIQSITYHLPNFAERFYRKNAVPPGDPFVVLNAWDVVTAPPNGTIYLNKLAASIRDYIDTDSQPTIINNDPGYPIRIGTTPAFALGAIGGGTTGANEVIAIGKERVPFFSEYMLRVKQVTFDRRGPYPPDPPANYKIEIDHYCEFWNMSNRDIAVSDLGPNPFFRVANQFGWNATGTIGTGTNIPEGAPRDFSIPLSTFKNSVGTLLSFPAGSATILTTDTSTLPSEFTNVDQTRVFRPDPPLTDPFRVYSGTTTLTNSNNWMRLKSNIRTTSGDYETEILLGNDLGILDSTSQGAFITDISVDVDSTTDSKLDTAKWHFRGSRPNGNVFATTPSTTGDPRTNNEQLSYRTITDSDRTRYKAGTVDSVNRPGETTLTLLNANFVDTTKWTDPSDKSLGNASRAPAVVANAELKSIGELGAVFDSIRRIGVSNDILFSRGGGRTLRIGQPELYDATTNPDGLWDGNASSNSREWTAWRLADIFTVTDNVQLEGRINVNGVSRDGGAALKAALFGYNFQSTPESDPSLAGGVLSDTVVQTLVDQVKARLTNGSTTYPQFSKTAGPLLERGEISELPLFSPGTGLVTSPPAFVYDRGREGDL